MSLDSNTFLNPDFAPENMNAEHFQSHRASSLAIEVQAMIDTAWYAIDNDTSRVPMDRRGIAKTLEVISRMTGDLVDQCELLERRLT